MICALGTPACGLGTPACGAGHLSLGAAGPGRPAGARGRQRPRRRHRFSVHGRQAASRRARRRAGRLAQQQHKACEHHRRRDHDPRRGQVGQGDHHRPGGDHGEGHQHAPPGLQDALPPLGRRSAWPVRRRRPGRRERAGLSPPSASSSASARSSSGLAATGSARLLSSVPEACGGRSHRGTSTMAQIATIARYRIALLNAIPRARVHGMPNGPAQQAPVPVTRACSRHAR